MTDVKRVTIKGRINAVLLIYQKIIAKSIYKKLIWRSI